jgi:PPOX class probable FMN-dependent enzyme
MAVTGHPRVIQDEAALREVLGHPNDVVRGKITDRLNELTRQFVEASPFLCLATSAPDGTCDVTPRGDPPGFVQVLDDRTLLLPERPGNRLADSLRNVLGNPHVGLLFVVPGVTDTLRVNGRASIVDDPELLAPCAVEGKVPKLGLLVEVEEVFTHCSKAFLRAQLWDPSRFRDRSELPSPGTIMASLNEAVDPDTYDVERTERYRRREGFY